MDEQQGLRARKKEQTRQLLMRTAVSLFEERGFDNVSVAEVAAAAMVSKKTVFNYFECKEDLVLGAGRHHIGEPAAVVRAREPGQTPHGALCEYLLTALAERQPFTGLSDLPHVRSIQVLLSNTPALGARSKHYQDESRDLLAHALMEEGASPLSASLIAAQLLAVQEVLAGTNAHRIIAGQSPDAVYPDAVAATEHAFGLLEKGLGDLLCRPSAGP
ncbi:hypothetical protein N566_23270 [Streptomycetaceae bacterium MP113-05]|nr:hypothetical protein N566_23270 [Streptomycetaceae bacterium MP113-05]